MHAGDIDLLAATRSDVDRFAEALGDFECLVAPQWMSASKQYFARFLVEGAEVEVSTVESPDTGPSECTGAGPWERFDMTPLGDYIVPTVAMELRLVSELVRDRPDRIRPLIVFLRERGYDSDLLERSMEHRAVAEEIRRSVRAELALRG